MRALASLFLLLVFSGCVATSPDPRLGPPEAALEAAMAKRLTLAREVAWIKFRDGRPVRDPEREAAVLAAVTAQGSARGLSPAVVRAFFAAQIAASCAEQERLIKGWSRGGALPTYAPRDLQTDVRQDIDRANAAILAALPNLDSATPGLRFRVAHALRQAGFRPETAALAASPL